MDQVFIGLLSLVVDAVRLCEEQIFKHVADIEVVDFRRTRTKL